MFLEVAEEKLEHGKAYLLGTWPIDMSGYPEGTQRKNIGKYFGPITVHRFALDIISPRKLIAVTQRIPEGEQIIASYGGEEWIIHATTEENTPMAQEFERISIYIEEEDDEK